MLTQQTLRLTAKLDEIPTWENCLDITCLGRDLDQLFEQEILLPGVILTQNHQYQGMISRESFFKRMSRSYGQDIFSKRPLAVLHGFIKTETLVLSNQTPIIEAIQTALQRPPHLLYEPIVVKFEAEIHKVLDFYQLLLGYTQIPDLVLRRLQKMEQEARATEANFLQLQTNYAQHIQTEKMAALGQLVAGFAHEINNPVNFIYGNLAHAENYIHELLDLVTCYQDEYPTPSETMQAKLETIDLDFLKRDLPKLLGSLKVGTERICDIVKSLRNFSRLDEAEFKAVDIHEGIDSTLLILQHRLKAMPSRPEIEVVQEYGDLPSVKCYAGQLNQVFMNILVNAIDAIEEFNEKRSLQAIAANPNRITIRTSVIHDVWIQIVITDNGSGMPEVVQKRIFDPFFTTKPIGKGTGMGMSISYQIITEKHGGKLECFSTIGKGTEFIIRIPKEQ
ncbi:ATP-binding protein [Phormidesmis priestleyi]|uniref:ATP-binding protein n=1 Tax=Phormidesmis priestleyi TaxID=268141 RepID=UPI00083A97FB|nr:ATP-binding protein [Phormidesmis priestleyi]